MSASFLTSTHSKMDWQEMVPKYTQKRSDQITPSSSAYTENSENTQTHYLLKNRKRDLLKCLFSVLPTWGRNIFPAPKRSPTTFMPFIRGPSIIFRGRGYFSWFNLASSVSSTMCFSMPLKEKKKEKGGRGEQTSHCIKVNIKEWIREMLKSTNPRISLTEFESCFSSLMQVFIKFVSSQNHNTINPVFILTITVMSFIYNV